MEVIVKYNGDIIQAVERIGAQAELLSHQYAIVSIEESRLPELYGFTEIEDIELSKRLYIKLNYQLTSSCITSVQEKNSFHLLGKGTIAAIIDSGIDYTHVDFRNEDGSTRIIALWDQTIEGNPPDGFLEGTEYNREQLNEALDSPRPFTVVPSRDNLGHGTAVAGIAAGNGQASAGENRGAAPLCELLVVKVGQKGNDTFAQSTEIMRAVKYVTDKARMLGRPVAINLSFGMNNGAHDGQSLFEEYLTAMSSEWKSAMIIPTGNEGAAGHHYEGRITSDNPAEIAFFTASGIETFYLTLWKDFADSFAVELILPNGTSAGVVTLEDRRKQIRLGNLLITILYEQPTRYSVRQEIFINVQAQSGTIAPGAWLLRILPTRIVNGTFTVWLPTLEEVTAKTYFSRPTVNNTITLPATARKVIRVAGYNDRIGSIAPFSGVGRVNDPDGLPDIAAPAVNILAPRTGGGYDAFTGTSFAAPFVTGSALLMMEWAIVNGNAPFFYGERLRAYLRWGANRSVGLRYPNPTFGYGRLCLDNTLQLMQQYAI